MDSYEINLDTEHKLVRVKAIGEIVVEEGKKLITLARQTAGKHNYDILYDIREASTNVDFHEWFYLPRTLDVLKDAKTRNVKAAILVSPNDVVKDYKFYEVVSDNVGLQIRFFLDETEALIWLTKDKDNNNSKN